MSLSARLGQQNPKPGENEPNEQQRRDSGPGQRYRASGRAALDPVNDVRLRLQRRACTAPAR